MTVNNTDLKIEYIQPDDARKWHPYDTQDDRTTLATDTRYLTENNTPSNLQHYLNDQSQLEVSIAVSPEWIGHPHRHKIQERCELFPRKTTEKKHHFTVGDAPSNKKQHPLYLESIPLEATRGRAPDIPWRSQTAHENQVIFDHPHKKQVNRSLYSNQAIFGPHTKTKSISTPRTKIRSISIPILKSSQSRSPTQKQVNFDLNTAITSHSIPILKVNQFRCPDPKTISIQTFESSHFRPPHQKPLQFRSFRWKQVNFDLPHWHQVNFDHQHKHQVNSNDHTKPSHFRHAHKY